MRSSQKKLSYTQENHFHSKLTELNDYVKSSRYRLGFIIANKECDRLNRMDSGNILQLKFIRRGLSCCVHILNQYSRSGDKHKHQKYITQRAIYFIQRYYILLQEKPSKFQFYFKELLIKIAQLKVIMYKDYEIQEVIPLYFVDTRFHLIRYTQFLEYGHIYLYQGQFSQALETYQLALEECQYASLIILKKDKHLQKMGKQFTKIIQSIIIVCYIMSFVYELDSDYTKMIESLRISLWLTLSHNQLSLFATINDLLAKAKDKYDQYLDDLVDIEKFLKQFLHIKQIQLQQNQQKDYFQKLQEQFYEKYDSQSFNKFNYLSSESQLKQFTKEKRITEQETTITTPKYEKLKTNSFDDLRTTKSPTSQRSQYNLQLLNKQKIESAHRRVTTNYDIFESRLPKPLIETLEGKNVNKELDLFCQKQVLRSLHESTGFQSLSSIREQVISQNEINRINNQDFIVGRKLLKFQNFNKQNKGSAPNIMKYISDIQKEQVRLEAIHSARNSLKNSQAFEKKIQQFSIPKKATSDGIIQDRQLNDYESILNTVRPSYHEPAFTDLSKKLRTQNLELANTSHIKKSREIVTRKSVIMQK
ncbi:hypothetical protein pb186bvf_005945 [Paramecium bursaria]